MYQKRSKQYKIFQQKLSNSINKIEKKDTLIIGGDFNAKTKMTNRDLSLFKTIGKYAKSNINENGEKLIGLAASTTCTIRTPSSSISPFTKQHGNHRQRTTTSMIQKHKQKE